MDREFILALLLAGAATLVGSMVVPGSGALAPSSGVLRERMAFQRLISPLAPAVVLLGGLSGFALVETEAVEAAEVVPTAAVLLALAFGVVVARAVVRAAVSLLRVQSTRTAAAMGLLRPRTCIAEAFAQSLSAGERAAVQLHEEAHVRHRDPLRIWLVPDARLRFGLVRARLRDEAVLVSPIAGRIQHLAAAVVGQPVAIGQPIFSIVPILGTAENVAIKVQGADMQGQITALRGELTFREAEAVRARELAGPKIISAAKLQEAETAVQTARARLAALQQARGKNARGQSGDAEITVPVAGSIASIDVQVGAVVRAGDVLGRVLRAGPRWVEVAVDPGEAPADAYQVEAGGRWVEARRIATGAIVGADGMRRDRLEVTEAAELLYPGAVVSVRVIRGDTAGLILPASAVVASPSGRLVYVEVEPGVFAQRKVQLLAQVGDQARVAGPLASGDRVVSHGVMGLHGETLRSELRHTE